MNLLVTGGAGFIGSNFIRHIIDRPEVGRLVNFDCLTYAGHLESLSGLEEHRKYVFMRADLRDVKAIWEALLAENLTHIVHLAAESHVDRSIAGPDDFIHTNVVGTFNLLKASQRQITRFLHVSTDEVYGSLGPTGYFTEQSPYAPNSPYSASKAASDMLVRSYHHTYGFPAVITNCSNNYGPYQFPEKLIPVVIQSVLQRKSIPVYGDGMNVRDWLYVRDHAEALWQALIRGKDGETYNIGGNNEWPNIRIVELICDIIDELAPNAGGNSRKLITFVKDRPGHDRRYAKPAYTFERGIRETVQWYLDNQAWVKAVTSASKGERASPRTTTK
jgi:dTDP-glucose 4,6-dehydratase